MAVKQCLLLILVAMVPASLACIRGVEVARDYEAGSPSFCHGIECPEYTVLSSVPDKYEERRYEAAEWVSTEVLDLEYEAAVSTGFRRLFDYIQGENDREEKVAMTAPVATRVIPGQGPACETNFTIYFFVPPELVGSAPNPTNPDVHFASFPEQRLYVRTFDGYAEQDDWLNNARELGLDLQDAGLAYEESYYYTAGYDSPFRFLFRHNEVWFVAKETNAVME